jgi:hypothetical protein
MTGSPPQVNSLSLHLVQKTPVRSVWFLNTSRYQNRVCHVIVSVLAALVIVVTLFVLIMILASGSSVGLPNLR